MIVSLSRRQVLQIGLSTLAWQSAANLLPQDIREDGLGSSNPMPALPSDTFRHSLRDDGFPFTMDLLILTGHCLEVTNPACS
jgi:hypothetical protein